jgi:DNA-binding IclR family transcriptional regulator
MERDRDEYIQKTILKAGAIMKVITEAREPLGILQIVEKVEDIGKDSVFRTCVTLESMGWINRIGERYELGMGLSLLWAKKKATLEAQRIAIDKALALLGDD